MGHCKQDYYVINLTFLQNSNEYHVSLTLLLLFVEFEMKVTPKCDSEAWIFGHQLKVHLGSKILESHGEIVTVSLYSHF